MSELAALSVEECWRRLGSAVVGRVGFDIGRGLRIHPVNFTVADGAILVRTSSGSELARCVELFSAGATVAFEVDDVDVEDEKGWSVLIGGRISEVPEDALDAALSGLPMAWASGERGRLVKITPVEVTGRRLDADAVGP